MSLPFQFYALLIDIHFQEFCWSYCYLLSFLGPLCSVATSPMQELSYTGLCTLLTIYRSRMYLLSERYKTFFLRYAMIEIIFDYYIEFSLQVPRTIFTKHPPVCFGQYAVLFFVCNAG